MLGRDERGERVAAYVEQITREADLDALFRWDGDNVWFLT